MFGLWTQSKNQHEKYEPTKCFSQKSGFDQVQKATSSIVGWGFLLTSIGLPTTTCMGLGKGNGVLQ